MAKSAGIDTNVACCWICGLAISSSMWERLALPFLQEALNEVLLFLLSTQRGEGGGESFYYYKKQSLLQMQSKMMVSDSI